MAGSRVTEVSGKVALAKPDSGPGLQEEEEADLAPNHMR